MIEEPILAESFDPAVAKYPYLATPKVDGIRAYMYAGDVWCRSSKAVPNLHIRRLLGKVLPDGIDFELFCGSFNQTMSTCMTHEKKIESGDLTVCIFDYMQDPKIGYLDRVIALKDWQKSLKSSGWTKNKDTLLYANAKYPFTIRFLFPVWIKNFQQLESYYESCLADNEEGICLRVPYGIYKFGRSTVSEGYLLRYKPSIDRFAEIIGCNELQTNHNPSYRNELGKLTRSTAMVGLVGANRLGSFTVRDTVTGVIFDVGGGPGLTQFVRQSLWDRRHELSGKIIEYRSSAYGVKEKPRHPQFLYLVDERQV